MILYRKIFLYLEFEKKIKKTGKNRDANAEMGTGNITERKKYPLRKRFEKQG